MYYITLIRKILELLEKDYVLQKQLRKEKGTIITQIFGCKYQS